jgi:hypothetical protein
MNGRGGGIRTPDPLLPKQMRYQTALRPDLALRWAERGILFDCIATWSSGLGPQTGCHSAALSSTQTSAIKGNEKIAATATPSERR